MPRARQSWASVALPLLSAAPTAILLDAAAARLPSCINDMISTISGTPVSSCYAHAMLHEAVSTASICHVLTHARSKGMSQRCQMNE